MTAVKILKSFLLAGFQTTCFAMYFIDSKGLYAIMPEYPVLCTGVNDILINSPSLGGRGLRA